MSFVESLIVLKSILSLGEAILARTSALLITRLPRLWAKKIIERSTVLVF